MFIYGGLEPDRTAQWMRWNEFGYLTMILLKVDRASMHHSLEVRVPLLDKGVIEIASRVDWRSCLDVKRKLGKLPLRYSLDPPCKTSNVGQAGLYGPYGSLVKRLFETCHGGRAAWTPRNFR